MDLDYFIQYTVLEIVCITLGRAACMTGTDIGRIAQLPDTAGMPNPEKTGHTATSLQGVLLEQEPRIFDRVYNPDDNKIFINATEMTETEIDVVCKRITAILSTGRAHD